MSETYADYRSAVSCACGLGIHGKLCEQDTYVCKDGLPQRVPSKYIPQQTEWQLWWIPEKDGEDQPRILAQGSKEQMRAAGERYQHEHGRTPLILVPVGDSPPDFTSWEAYYKKTAPARGRGRGLVKVGG